MPRKYARPDADVERVAADLRTRWVPADGIAPWLRKNLPRLRRMARDDAWSWADIGRAMTLAGITYGSGKPWTGKMLTMKVAQAQNQLRQREAERPSREAPVPRPASPAVEMRGDPVDDTPQPVFSVAKPVEPALEPEFQIARPRSPIGAAPAPAAPTRPAVSRSAAEVDAQIAALLGRPKLGSVPMPAVPEPEEDE